MPVRYAWPLYALLLLALAALLFAQIPTLGLDTHDAETFRDHDRIAADPAFFFSPDKEQASGRPVAEAAKLLYYYIAGNSAIAFHLLAIALHVLCAFLVARVAHQYGADLETSRIGGLLFLANVAHFQVVHYISALDYALALALGLSALLLYQRHGIVQSTTALAAFYLLLLAAAFSHLSLVVILPFCFYYSWRRGEPLPAAVRRLLPLALLLALAFGLQLALASRSTSIWSSLAASAETSPIALIWSWFRVLLWLASRLLTTAHWLPLPVYSLQTWELFVGGLVLLGLGYAGYRRNLWAAWTLLALLPFVFLTEATLRDMPAGPSRYLYPASAGAALLLAQGLCRLRYRYAPAALCALLLFSSYLAGDQTEALSRYTSGRSYIAANQLPQGIAQLRAAIDLGDDAIDLDDAYTRLVAVALDSVEIAPAILQQARQRLPDQAKFTLAAAVFATMQADRAAAAQHTLDAAHIHSADNARWIGRLYANMAEGYFARQDWPQTIRAARYALRYDSTRRHAALRLGWTYFVSNRFEEAIATYEAILTQRPEAEPHFNLGLAHLALGDIAAATRVYAAAAARYGRHAAARAHLERFVALGVQTAAAQQLLDRHFAD